MVPHNTPPLPYLYGTTTPPSPHLYGTPPPSLWYTPFPQSLWYEKIAGPERFNKNSSLRFAYRKLSSLIIIIIDSFGINKCPDEKTVADGILGMERFPLLRVISFLNKLFKINCIIVQFQYQFRDTKSGT